MQDSGLEGKMQWILFHFFLGLQASSVQKLWKLCKLCKLSKTKPMWTEGKATEFELNAKNVRLWSLQGDVAQSAQQLHSRHVLVFVGWTRPHWPLWFRVSPHGFLPWCKLGLCLCELCESWIRWKYAFSFSACSKALYVTIHLQSLCHVKDACKSTQIWGV